MCRGYTGHWNHRVIRKWFPPDDYEFAIYEVYYNEDGNIFCWSEKPRYPWGVDLLELKNSINWFKMATEKPILEEKEIAGELKLVEISL